MKKIIILTIIILSLFSCSNGTQSGTQSGTQPADSKFENLSSPQKSQHPATEMILIGKYDISPGWLYAYRIGGDTVYIVEGTSSNFPVSISVK